MHGDGRGDVLGAAMDAVIMVDRAGCILRWNDSAREMFGRASEEVLGRELADVVVPEELRGAHRTGLARYVASGAGRLPQGRVETVGQRRGGERFPVELTLTPVGEGADLRFVGFLRDITERRQMLDDLRESRTRLLTASDDARRRVERDLHDGAQQQLVALAISLQAARSRLASDPEAAATLLDRSVELLTHAIDELRELARGVHNGVLTSRGLEAAVPQLARRSPLQVQVSVSTGGRLPPLVETSVYYLVAEALTNAARYGAQRVQVTLVLEPGSPTRLTGGVVDDGPGGADPARGTGLAGVMERLAVLGGQVRLTSPAGAGTCVEFTVPVLAPVPA